MVKLSDIINISFETIKNSVPNPRTEAELLVCHVLKKDRIYITIHKNDFISDAQAEEIFVISKKRADGVPFAYITGKKEFMSLEFEVNPAVLIPRPETEELVALAVELCKDKDVKILDLCAGSGAIAVSCAYYLPKAICHGIDISDKAIETAKSNAFQLGVSKRTNFWKYDVLGAEWKEGLYDVVISNPPYIESDTIETLDSTVRNFEPHIALDGGADGLVFYRKIISDAELYLKQNGIILFEIGYNQAEDVSAIMKQTFTNVKVIKDYSGNDRIVYGVLK